MSRGKPSTLADLAPAFMGWPVPAFDEVKPNEATGELEFEVWQAGRCGVCGTHQDFTSKRHATDHDHDTGLVRGLLCTGCNLQEGWQPNRTFSMWRSGLNPCAVFSWYYQWQPFGVAHKPLRHNEAEELVRHAAIREEVRQREIDAALQAMRDSDVDLFAAIRQVTAEGQATP